MQGGQIFKVYILNLNSKLKLNLKWEHIFVPISWSLDNLEQTYIMDNQSVDWHSNVGVYTTTLNLKMTYKGLSLVGRPGWGVLI